MIGEISSWIMSIAGVICLSVLIELLLPEGQMNKYIKGIFAFIIVLVILTPLPRIINKELNINFDIENSIEVDEDYLYQLNLDRLNKLKEEIEKDILKNGYKNVSVYINGQIISTQMQIKSVSVDLSSLVISQNAEHNDISKIRKHITKIIISYIEINEEDVLYNV